MLLNFGKYFIFNVASGNAYVTFHVPVATNSTLSFGVQVRHCEQDLHYTKE